MLRKLTRYYSLPFLVCGLAALFYPYEFMVRVLPSAMTQQLMSDFHMSAAGLGMMTSLFYYGYVGMQLPAGMLFDRFGPRILLTFSILICSVGTLLFGASSDFYVACTARFFIGFGGAFAFIGVLVLIARWFPAKHFAMMAGLVQLMGSLGAIVGEQPVAILVRYMDWRTTVYGIGAVGVVLSVATWLVIRDHPAVSPQKQYTLLPEHESPCFKWVYLNPQTWWTALYGFAVWSPVTIFAVLWGIPFLMVRFHETAAVAALGATVFWLGIAVGSPLAGWWSNKTQKRCPLLYMCAVLGVVASTVAIYMPSLTWSGMCVALFLCGVAAAGQSLSFGVVQDNNRPSVAGSAIAFNNMAVIMGGIFFQPVVGLMLEHSWVGGMLDGAPVYTLASYQHALLMVPLLYAAAAVFAKFGIKETYCRPTFPNSDHLLPPQNVKSEQGQST